MSNLQPLEDHVLILPAEDQKQTKSGILLPGTNKEKPGKGTVVAVGPGRILDSGERSIMDIKQGQVVYFTKYSPDEIEFESKDGKVTYFVVKHSSILAVEQ